MTRVGAIARLMVPVAVATLGLAPGSALGQGTAPTPAPPGPTIQPGAAAPQAVEASAGRVTRLAYFVGLTPDCSAEAPPDILIHAAPSNGALLVTDVSGAVPDGQGRCAGKAAIARLLLYRPRNGFAGEETVAYEALRAGAVVESRTVTIRVAP